MLDLQCTHEEREKLRGRVMKINGSVQGEHLMFGSAVERIRFCGWFRTQFEARKNIKNEDEAVGV